MILLTNRLRTHPVDEAMIKRDLQLLLDKLGYSDFDLGVLLTTDATIQNYNREFRGKDAPTDILSFPYHPDLQPGERIEVVNEEDKNIGDIIISIPYVERVAKERNIPFKEHLKRLLVHGVCHLLGYDHIEDEEYKIMLAKERELLATISDNPHIQS